MQYKKLGSTNLELSILGFGCMRFPASNADTAANHLQLKIDEKKSREMIEYAIANGVNYFDTGYMYHSGESEKFVGKVLKQGFRDKIKLATKLPFFFINEKNDMNRILNEQFERLQTDYFDLYLMHGINKDSWERAKSLGAIEFIEKMKKQGRAKYIGFSFHGSADDFIYLIDDYDWDFTQIQYNYYDTNYQAGKKGLKYAYEKGMGVVIMEPLRGGMLTDLPEDILNVFKRSDKYKTPAEWGLRWVWNHNEVSSVLSGMSSMEQLKENIEIANSVKTGDFTPENNSIINDVISSLKTKLKINCTNCAYCLPCPYGVNIPQCFAFYNDLFLFNDDKTSRMRYTFMLRPENKASNCKACGECVKKCPQQINIIEQLASVKNEFEKV